MAKWEIKWDDKKNKLSGVMHYWSKYFKNKEWKDSEKLECEDRWIRAYLADVLW